MRQLSDHLARAHAAPELPGLLDMAYDAFERILVVLRHHQEDDSSAFPAFVLAANAAADARDAIGDAPSLPPAIPGRPPPRHLLTGTEPGLCVGEVAVRVTATSFLLAGDLMAAAGAAADPDDRAACARAAVHALVICDLLGGAALP